VCAVYSVAVCVCSVQCSCVCAVYSELYATEMFEEMSLSADEDEHSIEMQLPYIAKVMERSVTEYCHLVMAVIVLYCNSSHTPTHYFSIHFPLMPFALHFGSVHPDCGTCQIVHILFKTMFQRHVFIRCPSTVTNWVS